ncbi:MAG: hypothetical protein H0U70_07920 [Tatlockia sp.]|nr:hypothetical protein [Tatlockia sp.]
MAQTEEEKRKAWLEKDTAVQDELLNIQRRMKRQHQRTVGAEDANAKALEKTKDPVDGKLYWDKVKENAHHMINDNAAGYQEWPNIMMSLCHYALKNAEANWYDPIDYLYFIPYRDEIGGAFVAFKNQFKDKIADIIQNPIDRRFFMNKDELPSVGYTAAFTNQGQLNLQIILNGKPATEQEPNIKNHLDTGIVAWAMTQDYERDAQGVFKDSAGNLMTNAKFQELNAEPENSLLKFLSGRFDLNFNVSPSP